MDVRIFSASCHAPRSGSSALNRRVFKFHTRSLVLITIVYRVQTKRYFQSTSVEFSFRGTGGRNASMLKHQLYLFFKVMGWDISTPTGSQPLSTSRGNFDIRTSIWPWNSLHDSGAGPWVCSSSFCSGSWIHMAPCASRIQKRGLMDEVVISSRCPRSPYSSRGT